MLKRHNNPIPLIKHFAGVILRVRRPAVKVLPTRGAVFLKIKKGAEPARKSRPPCAFCFMYLLLDLLHPVFRNPAAGFETAPAFGGAGAAALFNNRIAQRIFDLP